LGDITFFRICLGFLRCSIVKQAFILTKAVVWRKDNSANVHHIVSMLTTLPTF